MQPVRERGRDAEVPAAAAQRPEEFGVRRGVDLEDLALRRDELDPEQVVRREPVLGHQPAEAAAEGVAGDTGRRDAPPVTASPCSAAASFSSAQSTPPSAVAVAARDRSRSPSSRRGRSSRPLGHGSAGDVVAAAPDGDLEPCPPRERDRRDDVRRSFGSGRSARACGRPGRCARRGRVVPLVLGAEHRSRDLSGEIGDKRCVDGCRHVNLRLSSTIGRAERSIRTIVLTCQV